jgi:hypothetical protein
MVRYTARIGEETLNIQADKEAAIIVVVIGVDA